MNNPQYLYQLGGELKDVADFLKVCAKEPSKVHIMPRRYMADVGTLFKVLEAMKAQLVKCADENENYTEVEFLFKTLGL